MKRTRRTTIAPDQATQEDLSALSRKQGDMAVALTVDTWEPRTPVSDRDGDDRALWPAAFAVVKAMRDRAAAGRENSQAGARRPA